MRNVTKTLQTFLIACMSIFTLQAQTTDVTDTYLGNNAGFDTDFNFNKNTFEIVGNHILEVAGWTKNTTATYTIAGTIEYGIPVGFNAGSQPPSVGYGNKAGGALALSTGWGEMLRYYKDVTLPAGKYSIVTAIYNTGSVTAGTSLTGWIPNEVGETSVVSSLKTFPVGTWVTDTVDFVVAKDNMLGKIQVGLQSIAGVGSGSTAKILVDYVKLLSHNIDKTALEEKIEEVEQSGYKGSPGEAFIESAITEAKTVYNSPSPTLVEMVQAIEKLDAAISLFHNALLADLKIDGVTVTGFNAEKFAYTIVVSGNENSPIPQVEAMAVGAAAGAKVTIQQVTQLPGTAVVTVTPGTGKNDVAKVYTIKININYLSGWDANGAKGAGSEPNNFGWKAVKASEFGWATALEGNAGNASYYRDNFPAGTGKRSLSRFHTNEMYFPVKLKAGVIYVFSGSTWKINTGCTNTFEINTSEDRATGQVLGSISKSIGASEVQHSFEFLAPQDGTYYLHWYNTEGYDRIICYDLLIYPTDKVPFEVTFDSKGGSEVNKQYLTAGGKVTQPQAPTKDGFEFDGWWYTEDGFDMRWNFSLGIDNNLGLFAHWLSNTFYGISFDSQGGNDVPEQEVREGGFIEEPGEPTKDGFEFHGWFYNDAEWDFSQPVTSEMVLTAKWSSSSSIDESNTDRLEIVSVTNGVKVIANQPIEVKVLSVMGVVVKVVEVEVGETFIELPAGIYIINRAKVIVK